MQDFEIIWENIKRHEGEEFTMKRGDHFKYRIIDDKVVPDRTDFPLDKNQFAKAAEVKNLDGPGQIGKMVMGSSYVYAIITDPRIRKIP